MAWCEINRKVRNIYGKEEALPPRPLTTNPEDQVTIRYKLVGSEVESWIVFLDPQKGLMLGRAIDSILESAVTLTEEEAKKHKGLKEKIEWIVGPAYSPNPALSTSRSF